MSGKTRRFERFLGSYATGTFGPLFLVVGGVHGNEPAGVNAARRVVAELERRRVPIRGRFVALAGNLPALEVGARYLEEDFNRIWTAERILDVKRGDSTDDGPERVQQRDLLAAIETAIDGAWQSVVLLDLHSTSGDGPPFAIIGDTLANRRIAFAFGAPVILGIEENIEGTLLSAFGNRGHVAIGFEGGRHDDPSTEEHHVAAIWISLVAGGLVAKADVPEYANYRELLARAAEGIPSVVAVHHRQEILREEAFRMEPGYKNFQVVSDGELLARGGAAEGEDAIRARGDGILLLPRYQGQGNDGFFLGQSVRPSWLAVSTFLRKLKLERLLTFLPGITALGEPEHLRVNQRVARFLALEFFHLFGYRRCSIQGSSMVLMRRVESAPPRYRRAP